MLDPDPDEMNADPQPWPLLEVSIPQHMVGYWLQILQAGALTESSNLMIRNRIRIGRFRSNRIPPKIKINKNVCTKRTVLTTNFALKK